MAEESNLEGLKKMIENSVKGFNKDRGALIRNLQKFVDNYKSNIESEDMDKLQEALKGLKQTIKHEATFHEYILFFVVSAIMISIFAIFGYKLYKSLTERQRKRDEKLRAKSAKKKK